MNNKIVSINDYYLSFDEVCKNFNLSVSDLQRHIAEENIVPAIFYYLDNHVPDQHYLVKGGERKSFTPRVDIPKQPQLSLIEDVVYLHGVIKDSYPHLYKFAYVGLTPNLNHFRTKDNQPVEIYKLSDPIPCRSDDAQDHFIFAIEEVERFAEKIPDNRSTYQKRRATLEIWLSKQSTEFDPFEHKYTKEFVYEQMMLIAPKDCKPVGESARNEFFQGKKGRCEGCQDLIKFSSKARKKDCST